MEQLKTRELDTFYETVAAGRTFLAMTEQEEEILNKKTPTTPILTMLSQPSGDPLDKSDCLFLYAIDTDLSPEQTKACEDALRAAGCDMGWIAFPLMLICAAPTFYVRDVKKFQKTCQQGPISASHG
jgi:hypothetical protein